MTSLADELAAIPPGRRRVPRVMERGADPVIEIEGRRLVNLSSNNYLSLASDPRVIAAAEEALRADGAGAGASRLVSGTSPRLVALEKRLADLKAAPRALVTTSGFVAAQAAVAALAGRDDAVIVEKGAHASLVAAARLSGARLSVFRRRDPESLDRALGRDASRVRRRLVLLDGIHSMDGDIAPLPALLPIVEGRAAFLLIDDAHATGVLGPRGEGTLAHFGLAPTGRIIQMGTLSKALGGQGGFIAADEEVIELIVQKAPAFIYTTGLNPAAVGAALGALAILEEEPERLTRLRRNIAVARAILKIAGDPTPIVPVVIGGDEAALAAAAEARAAGFFIPAIRPPTVPEGTARLRLSIQAGHAEEDLARLRVLA
jgi:8-amino-7-oxononanoate synthase